MKICTKSDHLCTNAHCAARLRLEMMKGEIQVQCTAQISADRLATSRDQGVDISIDTHCNVDISIDTYCRAVDISIDTHCCAVDISTGRCCRYIYRLPGCDSSHEKVSICN